MGRRWLLIALVIVAVIVTTGKIATASKEEGSYVDEGGLKRNADGTLDHTALNLGSGRENLRSHIAREKRRSESKNKNNNDQQDIEPPLTSSTENLNKMQRDRHRLIREHRREQRELDMAISHSLRSGLADKSREPNKEAIQARKKSLSESEQQSLVAKHRLIRQRELDEKKNVNKKSGAPSYSQDIKLGAEERARLRDEQGSVSEDIEDQHSLEKHASKIRIEMESTHPPGVDPTAKNYGLRYQATHMATFQIFAQTTESHYEQRKADKKSTSLSVPLARRGPLSKALNNEDGSSKSASPSLSPEAGGTHNNKNHHDGSKSTSKAFTRPVPLMDSDTAEVDYSQYTELGNITFALFGKTVPWTVTNFIGLCHGDKGFGYTNSTIHRIVKDYIVQGGDFEFHDGRGGHSYFCDPEKDELCNYKNQRDEIRKEKKSSSSKSKSKSLSLAGQRSHRQKLHTERTHFRHENYIVPHTEGTLSMADDGRKEVGSQWFLNIDHKSKYHMDKKYVAFGHIVHGFRSTIKAMNFMRTDAKHRPIRSLIIKGCHVEPFVNREVAWQYEHERRLLYGDIPTGVSTLQRMLLDRGGQDWVAHRAAGGTWDSSELWLSDKEVPGTWKPLAGGSATGLRHKRKQIRDEDDELSDKAKEEGSKEVLRIIAEGELEEQKSIIREVEHVKSEMVLSEQRKAAGSSGSDHGGGGANNDPLKALLKEEDGKPNENGKQPIRSRRPSRSLIPKGLDPAVHTEADIKNAIVERRQAAVAQHRKGPRRIYEKDMGLYYANYQDGSEEDSDDDDDDEEGYKKQDVHDDVFNQILEGPAKGSHQAAHSIREKKLQQREERKQAYLSRKKQHSKSIDSSPSSTEGDNVATPTTSS